MRNLKETFGMISALALLMAVIQIFPQTAYATQVVTTLKLGDYVEFGSYNSSPIIWRVINVNDDSSVMLYSEKILCIKPFDAAESGLSNQTGGSYTTDKDRQRYGSNNWKSSNIREWLNSDKRAVVYTTQPPNDSAVWGNMNSYAKEAGFLTNFTEKEKIAIQPVTHKSLLSGVDSKYKNGGTQKHKFEESIDQVIANYDSAYYENVIDKVFLLDVRELKNYIYDRGWEYRRGPTDKALDNADDDSGNGATAREYYREFGEEYWFYWLRSPYTSASSWVRDVDYTGSVYYSNAQCGGGGIVPALNLKSVIYTSDGNGSINNPYKYVGVSDNKPTLQIKNFWNQRFLLFFKGANK